jgi:cysteinyl-tRNA synthetase
MLSLANEKLDLNPKDKSLKFETNSNILLIQSLLGVGGKDPFEYFKLGMSEDEIKEIDALVAKRDEAKKAKDYATSDLIRDTLLEKNIKIMDTPDGTVWERDE